MDIYLVWTHEINGPNDEKATTDKSKLRIIVETNIEQYMNRNSIKKPDLKEAKLIILNSLEEIMAAKEEISAKAIYCLSRGVWDFRGIYLQIFKGE